MILHRSSFAAALAAALLAASSASAFVVKAPQHSLTAPHVSLPGVQGPRARVGSVLSMSFSPQDKLAEQAAKLRAEAEKLEKELAAVAATRPRPAEPEPGAPGTPQPPKALTFEQRKAEVVKAVNGASGAFRDAMTGLKEQGVLSKFGSSTVSGYRRFTADAFQQQTGFAAQEIESGGQGDDLKVALGVVLAISTLAVFAALSIGGNVGTTLVYLALLAPITFLGIGSAAPGVISIFIVLFLNLLDGKSTERKITHEAARFVVGYILGLPIEAVREGELMTGVKFYDTADGNFADLARAAQKAGPDAKKGLKQDDILPSTVLALAGSVAERMEFGKVIDKQGDFLYFVALVDAVRPPLRAGQKNDLVIYSALQAYKILSGNKSRLERVKEKLAAKAPFEELVAAMEE